MVQLTVKYDPYHDAFCTVLFGLDIPTKHRYGRQLPDPEKKLRPILLPAYRALTPQTTQQEKIAAFEKILADPTQNDFDALQKIAQDTMDSWNAYGHRMINFLERLYQSKFPFNHITGLIETRGGCGYNPDEATVGILFSNKRNKRLNFMLHEFNHYMFHSCYSHLLPVLGEVKWHIIKEAMTIFSNPAEPEHYPACQKIRNVIRANFKNWKSLNQAVNASLPLLYE